MPSAEHKIDHFVDNVVTFGETIGDAPPYKQLFVGGLAGWAVGFIAIRFGKPIALLGGGALLLFQLGTYENGRRKTVRDKIKKKAENIANRIDREVFGNRDNPPEFPTTSEVKKYIKDHSFLVSGFVAGLLLGIGTS